MAGKAAHPPTSSGPPGEHREREPQAAEREGPLAVERTLKDDGRALIAFAHELRAHEQQP